METSTNLRRYYSEYSMNILNGEEIKGNIEDNLDRNPESLEVDSYFVKTIMQTRLNNQE
jgi:hypothetical protein